LFRHQQFVGLGLDKPARLLRLTIPARAFVDAVSKAKPAGAKGAYLKKVSLSSTMGPGVSVDLSSATA